MPLKHFKDSYLVQLVSCGSTSQTSWGRQSNSLRNYCWLNWQEMAKGTEKPATSGSKRSLEGRISQTCWWDVNCLTQHWYFLVHLLMFGAVCLFLFVGPRPTRKKYRNTFGFVLSLGCFSAYCETLRRKEATLERHASGTDFFKADSGLHLQGKKGIC